MKKFGSRIGIVIVLAVCAMICLWYCDINDGRGEVRVPGSPDASSASIGWMELPAMDDPDLGYCSHSFKMGGKTYRNYTFAWNRKEYVALWAAYPLCGFYTARNVSRTDEWAYDPKLGKEASSAPFGGYGGDYARGHQVPSADRLCCREANVQTFYGTNITPQLNRHNEGIWSRLEEKIRTIADNSDTTYVITGCIVDSNGEKTTDSDGNRLGVPEAYYKAILRYSRNSTQEIWRAAAFYTEHKDYGKASVNDVVVSIDYLEQLTGIDFFVNLPARVGEAQAASLEASTAIWW